MYYLYKWEENFKPWITENMKKSIKVRHKLYKEMIKAKGNIKKKLVVDLLGKIKSNNT